MPNRVVSVVLRGEIGDFVGKMKAASSAAKSTVGAMTDGSKEAANYRQNLSDVGSTAGKIGLAAVAGLGAIIVTTAKFDKAMSAVQAATHESSAAMEDLRAAAIKAGADTAFSASEAAQGIEELAKAGVSTEAILGGGLNGALDLAAAGALGVGDAAEIAATAMTQFKLKGSEVPHVADLLAAGAGKAQGSVEDMGAALGQSGLVAAQTGLTIEETTGTLAAFASAGLIGSDSGTSFKTMLQSLTPTGEKAANEMARLGISAYDAQGNFVGMTEFADSLRNGLKDLSVEQQNAAMKTIFGSDAVRAASVVFQQGGEGIQSWIDKVDDSGYASVTAATRLDNFAGDLEAFKGSLETALIGAGEGSTGPLRDLTQSATNAVNAFNALPGPLKGTATAMLGVTAVLGGGLWFTAKTIAGVAAMRANLAALGVTSAAASRAMVGLTRGGAGLAAFWAGAELGDKVGERSSKAIDNLGQSLQRFAKTGKASGDLKDLFGDDLSGKAVRFGKDLGSIGEAIKSLEGYADDNSLTETLKFFGSAGQSAGIVAQAEALGDLDSALSNMAKNKPDEAIEAFEKLRDRAMETGASAEDVARAFPTMAETLRSASETMGGSSDASEVLAGSLTDLGPAAAEAAADVKAAQEALDKARESALATSLSFFNFSRDAKQSFGDYLDQLEKSADAYANFAENVIQASANGLDGGLIDQLKEQGPEGALALADFADASEKEIDRANRAFRDTEGLSDLQAELDLLPDDIVTQFATKGAPNAIKTAADVAHEYKMSPELVSTVLEALDYTKPQIRAVLARMAELDKVKAEPEVRVETSAAETAVRSLQNFIDRMRGKTLTINTVRTGADAGSSPGGTGATKRATGGAISGAGTGTSDDIPAWLSNGEHVLTAAEVRKAGGQAAIYRMRSAIRSGSMPAFASGGAVDTRYETYKSLTKSSKLDLAQQEQRIQSIQKSLSEKETVKKDGKKVTRDKLRGLDRTVAELELKEAKAQLAKMQRENEALKAYGTSGAEERLHEAWQAQVDAIKEQREAEEDAAKDAADAAKKAAEDARKEAEKVAEAKEKAFFASEKAKVDAWEKEEEAKAKAREEAEKAVVAAAEEIARKYAETKQAATSKFGIGAASSAAAVDRNLSKLLADSSTFLGLLGDLKGKGASPWLLAQLVEAGPTPGAIKLARQYATDQNALDSINTRAAQIDAYGTSYANLVGNAAFLQQGASNNGVSSAPQASFTASIAGAEIAVGSNGLMHFVKGQIVMSQDAQAIEARMS